MRRNLQRSLLFGVLIVFIISGWGLLIWNGRQSGTIVSRQGDLLRFHVLANSDSPSDQQLKMAVRDAVIEYLSPYLKNAADGAAARQIVTEHSEQISLIARQVLTKHHSNYQVQVQIGTFEFPIKTYGNLVLPAGKYQAVRILIGRAEGQNWWCVLFPPLCFIDMTNATAVPAVKDSVGYSGSADNRVELRWKLLELWNNKDKNS